MKNVFLIRVFSTLISCDRSVLDCFNGEIRGHE